MNELEQTFCEVMQEWHDLVKQCEREDLTTSDLGPLNVFLHAHGAALVAAKRDQVRKLRVPVRDAAEQPPWAS